MDKNSNAYVIKFALIICVVCSAALAMAYNVLRPRQEANAEFDRQRNVLKAAGLYDPADTTTTRPKLEQLYKDRVTAVVVEGQGGEVTTAPERVVASKITPDEHAKLRDAAEKRRVRLIYVAKDESGGVLAYVLPISGKGLWSTLYGYLALGPDANTVKGITFYKHGETPGLGGEVDNPNWTAQWADKQILADAAGEPKLVSVVVKKGTVNPENANEKLHYVDGLAGATITSNGVTRFVQADLQWYAPYFKETWARRN